MKIDNKFKNLYPNLLSKNIVLECYNNISYLFSIKMFNFFTSHATIKKVLILVTDEIYLKYCTKRFHLSQPKKLSMKISKNKTIKIFDSKTQASFEIVSFISNSLLSRLSNRMSLPRLDNVLLMMDYENDKGSFINE